MGFSGSSSNTSSSSESQTQLPAWVQREGEQLFYQAKDVANRPYPLYNQPRIAGFTPDQQAGFEVTRGNVGSWSPAFHAAIMGTGQASAPVGAQDIDRYMNPYTQQVIDTTLGEMDRQHQRDTIGRHGAMAQRGSYLNEDRRAVIDNLARESTERVKAETAARLRSQGFQNALGQANVDRARMMQGAGQFQQLAPLRSQLGAMDAQQLQEIGQQQQAQQQDILSLDYDDFLRQFYYPQEQINYLQSALGATPYPTSQFTQQTQPQGSDNTAGQIAGSVASLAALAMMASDRKVKTDVKKVGDLPVYEYRYKTDPKEKRRVGPMAQDVEKFVPEAIMDIDGVKHVNLLRIGA